VTAAVKAGQAGGELTRGGRLPPGLWTMSPGPVAFWWP